MKLFIISAFLCFGIALSAIIERDESCASCPPRDHQAFRDKLKALEPMNLKGHASCKTCTFTGISDVELIPGEKDCTFRAENGDIVRQISVEWKSITAECDCDLKENPAEVIADWISSFKNRRFLECFKDTFKNMSSMQFIPSKMDAADVEDIQTCLPNLLEHVQHRSQMKKIKMGGSWAKIQAYMEIHNKPGGKPSLRNVKFLNKNNEGIVSKCEGSDALKEVCRCFSETKYLGNFAMSMFRAYLPCWVEREAEDFDELLEDLTQCKPE